MKRSKEVLGYLNSKFRGAPFFALYRTTTTCNLRCRMCSVWRRKELPTQLRLEQIQGVADVLKKLKIPYIILTGGESLLRPDMVEIIKIFSQKGFHCRIETNGGPHITRQLLDQAADAGVIDYSTSLDTLDRDKQDWLCQGRGLWQSAVDNLKYAINKFPGLLPHVNIVVSHHNLSELPELVKFISGLGAYCTLAPVVLGNKDETPLFKGLDRSFFFDEEDKKLAARVYADLLSLKAQGYKILNSTRFLKDSEKYIYTGNMQWQCDAGRLYLEIFPDGEVGGCNEIGVGKNILDGKFEEHFRTRQYTKRIEELRSQCPGCMYPIFREVSYHFNYSGVLMERIGQFIREMGRWD